MGTRVTDALTTLAAVLGGAGLWAAVRLYISWRGKIALRKIDAEQVEAERAHERENTGQTYLAETAQEWKALYLRSEEKREAEARRYESALADIVSRAKRVSDRPAAPHTERDTTPEPNRRRT